MTGFISNVVLPSIRPLIDEITRLEVAYQPYPSFVHHYPPVDRTRSSFVPDVPDSRLASQESLPILPRGPSCSLPRQPCFQLSPLHGDIIQHDPNESVTPWNHHSQSGFLSSPSLSSSSSETASPSPPPYFLSLAFHNDLQGAPRLGSLSSVSLNDNRSGRSEDAPPKQATRSQPEQMVEQPPSPHCTIPESSKARRSPFDLCHLADSLPSLPLSPAPSVESSTRITAGRLPFPLVPTTSSQPVPQGLLPEVQAVSRKKKSGKASRAPRVDTQMTKAGKPYTRARPGYLKLTDGVKPTTRRAWGEREGAIVLDALERYTSENPNFIISQSSQDEQHEVLPVIWQDIAREFEAQPSEWTRSYEGFLNWTAKNLGRPTTRNPAPCDRRKPRKSAKPKAKRALKKPKAKRVLRKRPTATS